MNYQQHPSYRQSKRAKRKAIREAKKAERALLRRIRALIRPAVRAAQKTGNPDHWPVQPYIRWSSRSRFGRLVTLGRTSRVQYWGIPGASEQQGRLTIKRYVVTSNFQVVALYNGRLYAHQRLCRVASLEDLRVVMAGLEAMGEMQITRV